MLLSSLHTQKRRWLSNLPRPLYRRLFDLKLLVKRVLGHVLYRGRERYCLLCGGKARKFLPVGYAWPVLKELHVIGGMRNEEGVCPFCLSNERERLVYYYLKTRTKVFDGNPAILHIAPERNLQKKLMQNPGRRYVTGDLDSTWVGQTVNIERMEFASESFDVVVCNHVLEHVAKDLQAMQEIYRVLRPGGWAMVQVPVSKVLKKTIEDPALRDEQERERRFGQYDHVRIYGQDYVKRLAQTGAQVETYQCQAEFGEEVAAYYGLNAEESIHIMKKPEKHEGGRMEKKGREDR